MCTDEEASNEGEDLKVQLFLEYLRAQEDEGFEGPFADWVGEELAEQFGMDEGEEEPELEEVRHACLPATLLHAAQLPALLASFALRTKDSVCRLADRASLG